MSVMWTPIRLTMSSGSPVSSTDTQYVRSTYSCNELQEVTTCVKEVAKITPPLHNGVIQKPILIPENSFKNGFLKTKNKSEIMKRDSCDKCCQTDDTDQYGITRINGQDFLSDNSQIDSHFYENSQDQEVRSHVPEHIDVITTEPKLLPQDEQIDIEEVHGPEIVVSNNIENKSPIHTEKKEMYEEEKDSCCTECVLFSLQICQCCTIL